MPLPQPYSHIVGFSLYPAIWQRKLPSTQDEADRQSRIQSRLMRKHEKIIKKMLPRSQRIGDVIRFGSLIIPLISQYIPEFHRFLTVGEWGDVISLSSGRDLIELFAYTNDLPYERTLSILEHQFCSQGGESDEEIPWCVQESSPLNIPAFPFWALPVGAQTVSYRNQVGAHIMEAIRWTSLFREMISTYYSLWRHHKSQECQWLPTLPEKLLPIFNQDHIHTRQDVPVVFAPDEFTADEMGRRYSNVVFSAVPGGVSNLVHADLRLLSGREVHLILDDTTLPHGLLIKQSLQRAGVRQADFRVGPTGLCQTFDDLEGYASKNGIALLPLSDNSSEPVRLRIPKPGDPIPGGDVVPEMLLYPIIKEGELIWIYSDAKVGKSWTAQAIADAVASGDTVIGKWISVASHGVLLVDGEMSPDGLKNIIEMVIAGNGHTSKGRQHAVLCAKSTDEGIIDLEDEEIQRTIEGGLDGIKLLILDNFQSLTSNSHSALKNLRLWLRRINRSGVAVVVLDHTNRDGELQGSIEKERIADLTISLSYSDDQAKTEGRILVEFPAPRRLHGSDAEAFQLRKVFTEAVGIEPGSFRLELLETPKEDPLPPSDRVQLQAKVVFAKDTEGLSYPNIEAKYGIPKSTAHGLYKAAKTLSGPSKADFEAELQRMIEKGDDVGD